MTPAPNLFYENRLQILANRIASAYDRLSASNTDFAEGSLELAAALLAGREAMPANIAFAAWLQERGLDHYNKNDRAALIELAHDPALARKVLTETRSRSYQLILREYKKEQQKTMANTDIPRVPSTRMQRKKRGYLKGRADLHRRAKLGDAMVEALKDTSLARSEELDELVFLNRGAAQGEHTEIVKQLVADAVAGKMVSARAYSAANSTAQIRKPNLLAAWNKRMVNAWAQASSAEQNKFVLYLMDQMKKGPGHD
jgi:hypothetical protein